MINFPEPKALRIDDDSSLSLELKLKEDLKGDFSLSPLKLKDLTMRDSIPSSNASAPGHVNVIPIPIQSNPIQSLSFPAEYCIIIHTSNNQQTLK